MTPMTILQLAATPWTLTAVDAGVTLTARKACIADTCVTTGSPKLEEDGTWRFDVGVRVRWTSHTTAEVSLDGKSWSPGALTFATTAEEPPSGLTVLGAYASPSPGRWSKQTVACDRSKPVWVFAPIVRQQLSLAAYPGTEATWAVRTGVTMVMCDDAGGQYGGVY